MNIRSALLKEPEAAIPFAPPRKSAARTEVGDDVEIAGQTIVELLNQAVQAADANTKHALDAALKLSRELQAAEQRISDLEANLSLYKDRADRAEGWLRRVSSEIEQNFLRRLTAGGAATSR